MKVITLILACIAAVAAIPQSGGIRPLSASSSEGQTDVCYWKCFASFTKCRMNDVACIKKICHGQQEICGSCSFCSAWDLTAGATEGSTSIPPGCEMTTDGLTCEGDSNTSHDAANAVGIHDGKPDDVAEATTQLFGRDKVGADNSLCPANCADALDQCYTSFQGICSKLVCTNFKLSCGFCPFCHTSSTNPPPSIETRTITARDTSVRRCRSSCIDGHGHNGHCKLSEASP